MEIFCCNCKIKTTVKLIKGIDLYPHRKDLKQKSFWQCQTCNSYVGCHNGKKNRPLGCIPSPEIKNARAYIHKILDPIWLKNRVGRSKLYGWISNNLGYTYHTGEIRDIKEARKVYKIILNITKWLDKKDLEKMKNKNLKREKMVKIKES